MQQFHIIALLLGIMLICLWVRFDCHMCFADQLILLWRHITKCKTIIFYQASTDDEILHHEGVWEYTSWISLWWWLSICHLEGNFYFWILEKVFGDLFQRSHFFSSSANLKAWLPTQPLELMPFPMAQSLLSSHTSSQLILVSPQLQVFCLFYKRKWGHQCGLFQECCGQLGEGCQLDPQDVCDDPRSRP